MVKEVGRKVIAQNKKARHDYSISDVLECGLVLTGTEVKSLRAGRASLIDGFAMVNNGELWLMGVHIPEYTEGTWTNHTPRRDRKLLVHKNELNKLIGKLKDSGTTLVPLQLYFKDFNPEILEQVGLSAELTPGNIVNIKKAFVLESLFTDFNTEEDKKNILLDLVNRELILQKSNRSPIGFVQ